MADFWIKVEKSTPDKPEILEMAEYLNITDPDTNSELIEDGFNHWWGLYPSKKRVDKKGCSRKWQSKCKPLSEDQIIDLINSLSADIVKKAKEVEHLKFMPQTTTYLNQERWNDGE